MHTPIRNMRITFWGTQGSVQYFPGPAEVNEYARLIALDALTRLLTEMGRRHPEGRCGIQELLGGPMTPAAVERLLNALGRAEPPVYGGETTCTSVETAEGNMIVFDGGSGFRHFARHLVRHWAERDDRTLHLLGTHDHLDHRIGLAFSEICFVRDNPFRLNIFGNHRFLSALDAQLAVFSKRITPATHRDDPLDYRMLSARFSGTEIVSDPPDASAAGATVAEAPAARPHELETVDNCATHDLSRPIRIGGTTIQPFEVYHGSTPCLGYRVEHGGAKFIFCTDHERRHGPDPGDPRQRASEEAEQRIREHSLDADAAYFDGQFLRDEYHGRTGVGTSHAVPRIDWGHSCMEDCLERVLACRVKRAYIGHHDPDRSWPQRVELDQWFQTESAGTGSHIELAKDRCTVDL